MALEQELIDSIRSAWSRETCYPPIANDWEPGNPSLGQCAVTALLVWYFEGGELAYNREHHHYWNILPDGTEVDLTRDQFLPGTEMGCDEIRDWESVKYGKAAEKARTDARYTRLWAAVLEV